MKFLISILLLCWVSAVTGEEPSASLVRNGGFEKGSRYWQVPPGRASLETVPNRNQSLRVSGQSSAIQDVLVGERIMSLTAAVDMKVENIRPAAPAGYAYVAVYQLDRHNELVSFYDFAQARVSQDWQRFSYTFRTLPNTFVVSLRCGIFNAQGTAWFDNWTLVEGSQPKKFEEVRTPVPRTDASGGLAGIFREPGFPVQGAGSDPQVLADILQAGGLKTRFLSAKDLGNALEMRPWNLDLVVLPYGASFPASARESLIGYLHAGGGFISMGGYTFNHLVVKKKGRWMPEKEVLKYRTEAALSAERSLLFDGRFERPETRKAPVGIPELNGRWRKNAPSARIVEESPFEGKSCARVFVPAGRAEGETKWDLSLPAKPGHLYRVMASIRTATLEGPGFAYLALYQYDGKNQLVKHRDFAQVHHASPWTHYEYDFSPSPRAQRIYIKCGLYRASGTAWFDDFRLADLTDTQFRPMNTSTGKPKDGLGVQPAQMGVFDADYRLKRVRSVRANEGQFLFPLDCEFGPRKGWAASGVRGNDQTRWVPLLMAYDRFGRSRGSAGSLMMHYSGFYSGSSWAFFGAEDIDLFREPNSPAARGLQRLAGFMVRGLFLRSLKTDFASYRPGEKARVQVYLENQGTRASKGLVAFEILQGEKQLLVFRTGFKVKAGDTQAIETVFDVPGEKPGLLRIRARLFVGNRPIDQMETGFVVFQKAAPTEAAPLRFRDNYFALGDRALFLFGNDNYSNVYQSSAENPLWWDKEHQASQDFGFNLYENLQFSHPDHRMTERDWRQFEAMSQLTQAHGLVFMPGLLIGHNVAVARDEIERESQQCREYAKRLGKTPRLLWYINGDYRLRHLDKAVLSARWNEFLRGRYTTSDALNAAWSPHAKRVQLGEVPLPPGNSGKWDDARAIDLLRFNLDLMKNWNTAHVSAIRSVDRQHPITSEYYNTPFYGIDLRLTIGDQDVSNIGYFDRPGDDIKRLPWKLRWNDLRARGKSFGLGEYGVKTHPAWSLDNAASGYHPRRTEEEQKQLFMAVAHYVFGMGGSRVQNWCLRDANQRVFPWGVFYPGLMVPKDIAYVHRNLSLLFRMFEPVDQAPPLTVLLCDNLRLGNKPDLGTASAYRCFEALLGLHADFNVVSDTFADRIPSATRALIYPSALCPDDAGFAHLLKWVRSGGKLLVTGDFGYSPGRRHDRLERLKQLAGVTFNTTRYAPGERKYQGVRPLRRVTPGLPELSAAPMVEVNLAGAQALALGPGSRATLTRFPCGKGTVYWFADPLEMDDGSVEGNLRALYGWFLEAAGIPRLPAAPADSRIHHFAQRTRTGKVHILFNTRTGDGQLMAAAPTAAGLLELGLKNRYPALGAVTDQGQVVAAGCYKKCRISGKALIESDDLVSVVSLDRKDLRQSRALLLLPFSRGRARIGSALPWKHPVIDLGDVHRGLFRSLERRVPPPGTSIDLSFDEDQATLVALICEEKELAQWRQRVSSLLRAPELWRGY